MRESSAARIEDLYWLDDQGETLDHVLNRLGIASVEALDQFCRNHGIQDMAARIRHRSHDCGMGCPSGPIPQPPMPSEVAAVAARATAPVALRARGEYELIDVDDLRDDPSNLRDGLGDLDDLAASIEQAGLLQPVVARREGENLIVVAGHRRLAAVRELGWGEIPCIVHAGMRPDEVLAAMLIENGQRRDLDDIEMARALSALRVKMGNCTHAAVAKRIGRSQAFVSERLALLNLSAEDQRLVREKRFKLTQAIARGRENAGQVKSVGRNGQPKAPSHFSQNHPLANQVMRRCSSAGHSVSNSQSVGGSGCGECWESVIRADERQTFVADGLSSGVCALCGKTMSMGPLHSHEEAAS